MILNEDIRAREVCLIGVNDQQIDIVSKNEALHKAADADLDLVLLSPDTKPPVTKIIGYGKFHFEQQKKAKENRKNQKAMAVKEIRLSPVIEDNDFDTKLKHIRRFLTKDAKVRVPIRFRGRTITHKGLGKQVSEKTADEASDLSNVAVKPKMESRSMFLMLVPLNEKDKKKK